MSDHVVENMVVVNILGEDYPVTGVTNPSHISRVADFVDAKMKEVAHTSRTRSRDGIAILAAMSIASELLERNDGLNRLEERISSQAASIVTQLDQALAE